MIVVPLSLVTLKNETFFFLFLLFKKKKFSSEENLYLTIHVNQSQITVSHFYKVLCSYKSMLNLTHHTTWDFKGWRQVDMAFKEHELP